MEELTEDLIKDYYNNSWRDYKVMDVEIKSNGLTTIHCMANEGSIVSTAFYEEFILANFNTKNIYLAIHEKNYKILLDIINEFNNKK
jgi:hypothetical protein